MMLKAVNTDYRWNAVYINASFLLIMKFHRSWQFAEDHHTL